MAQTTSSDSERRTSPGRSGGAGGLGWSAVRDVPHTRIESEQQMEDVYMSGEKLGEGSFGVVWLVTHRETAVRWACKAISKEKAGSSKIKLLEREVDILKKVNHDHIIQLQEVFETSKKMFLVMEYCSGGELADALKASTFPEDEVKTIVKRLASAVGYMHKKGMVHRDLKLENILLAENPHDHTDKLYIKVTDFGLSVTKGGFGHEDMMMDFCGTPMYMAPEIIDNKTYSEMCDIWAMGVITFMLICGNPPFVGATEDSLYEMVKTTNISTRFVPVSIWSHISAEAKDCICGMLHNDPAHRLTAHEVLDHPWLTGQERSERSRNVLELMKEWKNDLEECSEEGDEVHEVNGKQTSVKDSPSRSHKADTAKQKPTSTVTTKTKKPPATKPTTTDSGHLNPGSTSGARHTSGRSPSTDSRSSSNTSRGGATGSSGSTTRQGSGQRTTETTDNGKAKKRFR